MRECNEGGNMLKVIVNEKNYLLNTEVTPAVTVLRHLLPMTLQMDDLNGNEKYCYLAEALPARPERIGRINAGDVMLFGDDCLVIFYKSFNTAYTYTRIGHISDAEELVRELGEQGACQVTFEDAG